jgi:hypothetical protein
VLTALVDVRCGGEVFATEVEYELTGTDTLLSGGVEFRRPGGG